MPRIRQKEDLYRNEDFRRDVLVKLAYLGLQQHDLAEYLGVCDATVSILLRSPEKIPVERLRKIINYLQLEPAAVLKLLGYQSKIIKEELN